MTPDEVFGAVRDAVVTVMEVEPGSIRRESRLVEDLRCDSIALVEIADIVEERIGPPFRIEDADLDELRTVGEAVDYVVARLTAAAGFGPRAGRRQ